MTSVAAKPGDQWGALAGDSSLAVRYVAALADAYPDDTVLHTRLGAVQTPRVYAYGLDALEIASSGVIALTVDDVHVLDVVRTASDGAGFSSTVIRGVLDEGLALCASNVLGGTSSVRAGTSLSSGPSAALNAAYTQGGLVAAVVASAGATPSSTLATLSASSSGVGTAASFTAGASGLATVTASGAVVLSAGSSGADSPTTLDLDASSVAVSTPGSIVLSAGSSRLSVMPSGTVKVDGNLVVTGVYTSVSSTQLHVDETVLQLATSSNGQIPTPDELIGPAGLVIASVPAVLPALRVSAAKSLLWNNGAAGTAGLLAPAPQGATDEAFWELRGGALRLSATDPLTGTDVGYEFRAATYGLEIYQVWQSAALHGAKAFKRIGIFHGVPTV